MIQADAKKSELYDIKIGGVPLRIKSINDARSVDALVKHVNAKIEDALKTSKTSSVLNAALLTALNFASELQELKAYTHTELIRIESLAKSAISDLESSPVSQADLEV
jgi:cell division protein ZapA (FtsZ GTPase activity inhibitor)